MSKKHRNKQRQLQMSALTPLAGRGTVSSEELKMAMASHGLGAPITGATTPTSIFTRQPAPPQPSTPPRTVKFTRTSASAMWFSEEDLTPALAKDYRLTMGPNRKVNRTKIAQFKRDILADEWCVTHQGLAFDTNGKLIDGEHRCIAVEETGVTIRTLVARGCAPESKEMLDAGSERNTAARAYLAYGVPQEAAPLLRAVGSIDHGWSGYKPDPKEVRCLDMQYGAALQLAKKRFVGALAKPVSKVPVLAACIYAYETNKTKVNAFMQVLAGTVTQASQYDPPYVLREWIQSNKKANSEASRATMLRVSMWALHQYVLGNQIRGGVRLTYLQQVGSIADAARAFFYTANAANVVLTPVPAPIPAASTTP